MSTGQIEGYVTELDELPSDLDLMDISVLISVGPDVYETRSVPYSLIKGVNLVASKVVDCSATGKTLLDWNCSGKSTTAVFLLVKNTISGAGIGDMEIMINKDGGGDIIPLTVMTGFSADGSYLIPTGGILPQDVLSDSEAYELEIIVAASITCKFEIHATHADV